MLVRGQVRRHTNEGALAHPWPLASRQPDLSFQRIADQDLYPTPHVVLLRYEGTALERGPARRANEQRLFGTMPHVARAGLVFPIIARGLKQQLARSRSGSPYSSFASRPRCAGSGIVAESEIICLLLPNFDFKSPRYISMAPSDFANADIDSVLEQLTLEEAISLTAGVGFWHTAAVPRLGVPALKVCLCAIFVVVRI